MTGPLLYSFDTSAVINGRRDLLPPDVFPTVWSKVEELIALGAVRAVDEVRLELGKRDDATNDWAHAQSGLFVPLEADIQISTSEVLRGHPKLMGVGKGRNAADPFVIGLARARGGTVVTQETPTGNLIRPKIPDVCRAIGVRCVALVDFIRDQRWTF